MPFHRKCLNVSVCYDLEIRFVLDLNEFSPNTWNWHVIIRVVCIILHVGLHATPAGPHRRNDVVPKSVRRLTTHRQWNGPTTGMPTRRRSASPLSNASHLSHVTGKPVFVGLRLGKIS